MLKAIQKAKDVKSKLSNTEKKAGEDFRLPPAPCIRPGGSPPAAPASASLPQPILSNQGNHKQVLLPVELLSSAWIVGRAVSERNAGTCFLQAQARGGWHFLQAGSLGGTWQGGAWPDFSTVVCLVRTPVPYVTSVPIGYRVLERTKQTQLLTQRDLFPCGHHGQVSF